MSIKVLNSSKEWDSTISLGNLCQCSTTLTVEWFLLIIKLKFLHLNLGPLPLVHSALWTHLWIATGFHLLCRILLGHKCRILQAITQMFLCFMSYCPHFGCVIFAAEGHGVYGARTDFTDLKMSATKVGLFISQHLSPSLSLSQTPGITTLYSFILVWQHFWSTCNSIYLHFLQTIFRR